MKTSIIIPVMNEEATIVTLVEKIEATVAANPQLGPHEIIFVDDGSTDGTWAHIEEATRAFATVQGHRLRRNFGKAAALQQGILVARGEIIATMDGDLQDDPNELPRFIEALDSGLDLVSGWKRTRHDPMGKTLPSKLFNFVVSRVSGIKLQDFNCGFKAYRREIFDSVTLYGELHRFIPVLAGSQGYRIGELEVLHHPRRFGKSKYGVSRMLKGFIDLLTVLVITRFDSRPGHLFGAAGVGTLALGLAINTWLTLEWFMGHPIGHRPALMLGVLLMIVGVQIVLFGMLAELTISRRPAPPASVLVRERVGPASTSQRSGSPSTDVDRVRRSA